jgi:hypothetical protein
VLLYHFAPLKSAEPEFQFMRKVEKISDEIRFEPAPEGLVPRPNAGWGALHLRHRGVPLAPDVVWLTTDPSTVLAPNHMTFRICVKISSTDRKLIKWSHWTARKRVEIPIPDGCRQFVESWYGYAGTIALDRVENIEFLPDQAAAWQRGGLGS